MDKTDREILDILTRDGRESFTKISELIAFSDTGIKKRLNKLNSKGILKIQGNVSLDALNFKACLLLLEVKNQNCLDEIIKVYSKCPYVFLTLELLGSFNLLMGIYGATFEDLDRKIKKCGPLNMEGVLHSKLIFISNFKIPQFIPLKILLEQKFEDENKHICEICEKLYLQK